MEEAVPCSDEALAYRVGDRFFIVSFKYLFVIEEQLSTRERLVRLLGESPSPAKPEPQELGLNWYILTCAERDVHFGVMTYARRPSPDDPMAIIRVEMPLLDLRLSWDAWHQLANSLREVLEALA